MHDDATGEIVLRDDAGTEHARFEDVEVVFADPNPYPEGGDRTVKMPIIPEHLLEDGATLCANIVTVPEGAVSLADLNVVEEGTGDITDPEELDVPEGVVRLFELLREDRNGGPWTTVEAHTLAQDSDDDRVHVRDRTIRKYLKAFADEGALRKTEGDSPTDPNKYHMK